MQKNAKSEKRVIFVLFEKTDILASEGLVYCRHSGTLKITSDPKIPKNTPKMAKNGQKCTKMINWQLISRIFVKIGPRIQN